MPCRTSCGRRIRAADVARVPAIHRSQSECLAGRIEVGSNESLLCPQRRRTADAANQRPSADSTTRREAQATAWPILLIQGFTWQLHRLARGLLPSPGRSRRLCCSLRQSRRRLIAEVRGPRGLRRRLRIDRHGERRPRGARRPRPEKRSPGRRFDGRDDRAKPRFIASVPRPLAQSHLHHAELRPSLFRAAAGIGFR